MKYTHGANTKSLARTYQIAASSLIDYSANINPLSEPAWLRPVYESAYESQFSYPDIEYDVLKRAISRYEGIEVEWITLGNGASPLFFDLVHHGAIQKATLLQPTFNEYEQALSANQAEIHEIVSYDYEKTLMNLDFQEALFICNPNNPTGSETSKEAILNYATRYPQSTLIIDESFMDFTDKSQSCLKDIETFKNIVVIKSYTKIFKCPGLRIGALFTANQELTNQLQVKTPPWSVNSLIEAILPYYLDDNEFLKETRKLVNQERAYLMNQLHLLGLKAFPSVVNFIMIRADFDLAEACLKQGIVIRDCQNFKGITPYTYRICVSDHQRNETLIEALKAAINHQSND